MTSSSEERRRRRKKNQRYSRKIRKTEAEKRKILINFIETFAEESRALDRETSRKRLRSSSSETSADSASSSSSNSSKNLLSSSPEREENRSESSRRSSGSSARRNTCGDRSKMRKAEDGSRRLTLKTRRGRRLLRELLMEIVGSEESESESDTERAEADKTPVKKNIKINKEEIEKTPDVEASRQSEKIIKKKIENEDSEDNLTKEKNCLTTDVAKHQDETNNKNLKTLVETIKSQGTKILETAMDDDERRESEKLSNPNKDAKIYAIEKTEAKLETGNDGAFAMHVLAKDMSKAMEVGESPNDVTTKNFTDDVDKIILDKSIFAKGKIADDDECSANASPAGASKDIDDKSLPSVSKANPLAMEIEQSLDDDKSLRYICKKNLPKTGEIEELLDNYKSLENKNAVADKVPCVKNIFDNKEITIDDESSSIVSVKDISDATNILETPSDRNNDSNMVLIVKNIYAKNNRAMSDKEKNANSEASNNPFSRDSKPAEISHCTVARKSYSINKIRERFNKKPKKSESYGEETSDITEAKKEEYSSESKSTSHCAVARKSYAQRKIHHRFDKKPQYLETGDEEKNKSSPESFGDANAREKEHRIAHGEILKKSCAKNDRSEDESENSRDETSDGEKSSRDEQSPESTVISQSTTETRRSYETKKIVEDFSEPRNSANEDDKNIAPEAALALDEEAPKLLPLRADPKGYCRRKIRKRNDSDESTSEVLESEEDESKEHTHGFKRLKRNPAIPANGVPTMENPGGKITVQSVVTLSHKVITVHTESAGEKICTIGTSAQNREIDEIKDSAKKIESMIETTDLAEKISQPENLRRMDKIAEIGPEKKTDDLPIVGSEKKTEASHRDEESTTDTIDRAKKISEYRDSSTMETSTQIDPKEKKIGYFPNVLGKDPMIKSGTGDFSNEDESLDETSFIPALERSTCTAGNISGIDLISENDELLSSVGNEEADKFVSIETSDREEEITIDKSNRSTGEIPQVQDIAEIDSQSTNDKTVPIATAETGGAPEDRNTPAIENSAERINEEISPISYAIENGKIIGVDDNVIQSVIDEISPNSPNEKITKKIDVRASNPEEEKSATTEARNPGEKLYIESKSAMENLADSSKDKILPFSPWIETEKNIILDAPSIEEKSTIEDKSSMPNIVDNDDLPELRENESSTIDDKSTPEEIADDDFSESKADETCFFSFIDDPDDDTSLGRVELTTKEMDSSVLTDEYASMMENIAEGDVLPSSNDIYSLPVVGPQKIEKDTTDETAESSDESMESSAFSEEFAIIKCNSVNEVSMDEAVPEEYQDLSIAPLADLEKGSSIEASKSAEGSAGEKCYTESDVVSTAKGSSGSVIEKIEETGSPTVLAEETKNNPMIDESCVETTTNKVMDDQKKSMSIFAMIKRFFGPDENKDTDKVKGFESLMPGMYEIDPGSGTPPEEHSSIAIYEMDESDLPLEMDDVGECERMNCEESDSEASDREKSDPTNDGLPVANSSMIDNTECIDRTRKIDEREENKIMNCEESEIEIPGSEKSDPTSGVLSIDNSSICSRETAVNDPTLKIDEAAENKSMNNEISENQTSNGKDLDPESAVYPVEKVSMIHERKEIDSASKIINKTKKIELSLKIGEVEENDMTLNIDNINENDRTLKTNEVDDDDLSLKIDEFAPPAFENTGKNISVDDDVERVGVETKSSIDLKGSTKIDKSLPSELAEVSGTEIDTETHNRDGKLQSSSLSIYNTDEIDEEVSKCDKSQIDAINSGISGHVEKSSPEDKSEISSNVTPSSDETESTGKETSKSRKALSIDLDKTPETKVDRNMTDHDSNYAPDKSDSASEDLARSKNTSIEDYEPKSEVSTVILRADVSLEISIDGREVSDYDLRSADDDGNYKLSGKILSSNKLAEPTSMDIDNDAQSKIDVCLPIVPTEDPSKNMSTKMCTEDIEFSNVSSEASRKGVGEGSAEINLKSKIDTSLEHRSSEHSPSTESTDGRIPELNKTSKNDAELSDTYTNVPGTSCDEKSFYDWSVESSKVIDSQSVLTEKIAQNDEKTNDGESRSEETQFDSRMDESTIAGVEDSESVVRSEHTERTIVFPIERASAAGKEKIVDLEVKLSKEALPRDNEEKNSRKRKSDEPFENVLEESVNQRADSPTITPSLTDDWMKIMECGLDKIVEENLTKKYLDEGNSDFSRTRSLNRDLKPYVSEISLTRDQRYVSTQRRLAAALSALGRATTEIIEKNLSASPLKTLNEAGQILANLHHENRAERRTYIVPELGAFLGAVADNSVVDDFLYDRDDREIGQSGEKNGNKNSTAPSLAENILKTLAENSKALRESSCSKNMKSDSDKKIGGKEKSSGVEEAEKRTPIQKISIEEIKKSATEGGNRNDEDMNWNEESGWCSRSLPENGSEPPGKTVRSPSGFSGLSGISGDFLAEIEKWEENEKIYCDDSSPVEIGSSESSIEISDETPVEPKESISDLLTREIKKKSTKPDDFRISNVSSEKIAISEKEKTEDEKMDFEDSRTTMIGSSESPIEILEETAEDPEGSISDRLTERTEKISVKSDDQLLDECVVTFARTVKNPTPHELFTKNSKTTLETSSNTVDDEKEKFAERIEIKVKNFAFENKNFSKDSSIGIADEAEEPNECVVIFAGTPGSFVPREPENNEDISSKAAGILDCDVKKFDNSMKKNSETKCHLGAAEPHEPPFLIVRNSCEGGWSSEKKIAQDSSMNRDDFDSESLPILVYDPKFGPAATGSENKMQRRSHVRSSAENVPRDRMTNLWKENARQAYPRIIEAKKSTEATSGSGHRHANASNAAETGPESVPTKKTNSGRISQELSRGSKSMSLSSEYSDTSRRITSDNYKRVSGTFGGYCRGEIETRKNREYPESVPEIRTRTQYFPPPLPTSLDRSDHLGDHLEPKDSKKKSEELFPERRSSFSRSDRSADSVRYATAPSSQGSSPEPSITKKSYFEPEKCLKTNSEKMAEAMKSSDSYRTVMGPPETGFGRFPSPKTESRQRSQKNSQESRSTFLRSEYPTSTPLTASDKYEHRFGQLSTLKNTYSKKSQKTLQDCKSEYFPLPIASSSSSSAIFKGHEDPSRDSRRSFQASARPSISSRSAPVDRPRSVQDQPPIVTRTLQGCRKENNEPVPSNSGLGASRAPPGDASDRARVSNRRGGATTSISRSSIASEKLCSRLSSSQGSATNEFLSKYPFMRPLYQAMPERSEELESGSSTKNDRGRSTVDKNSARK